MNAYKIKHYVSCLRDGTQRVDGNTLKIIDRTFLKLQRIAPCGEDDRRELWLCAERGTFEENADEWEYQELLEDGTVSSREEYKALWEEEYPDVISWFHLVTAEYKGFRAVYLGRRLIWQTPSEFDVGFEADLTELFAWIESAVSQRVRDLEEDTYNADISENLPPVHRTGYISRKAYWDLFPEYRQNYREGLECFEAKEFLEYIKDQKDDYAPAGAYIKDMTLNKFLNACCLGYAANLHDESYFRTIGLSPKGQYQRMADGRDDGMLSISSDDPEAFRTWYDDRSRGGGHPWEVCAGGNSTHIDLIASKDENGWFFTLRGTSFGRSVETIKFYNALRKAELPVCLLDRQALAARLTETDAIGIVPDGIFPRYCSSLFPGMGISDFMNLPQEEEEMQMMLPEITWIPEKEQKLIEPS